jgi:Zn-dependent alcohol dehydrogenase
MINLVDPKHDYITCIAGAGTVGLSALSSLRLTYATLKMVIVVDVDDVVPSRLKLAHKLGASSLINPKTVPNLSKALPEATEGHGIGPSLDATGRSDVVEVF